MLANLTCAVYLDILNAPVHLRCGHLTCGDCLIKSINHYHSLEDPRCPICLLTIENTEDITKPPECFLSVYRDLPLQCPEPGCEYVTALSNLLCHCQSHLCNNSQISMEIVCSNNGSTESSSVESMPLPISTSPIIIQPASASFISHSFSTSTISTSTVMSQLSSAATFTSHSGPDSDMSAPSLPLSSSNSIPSIPSSSSDADILLPNTSTLILSPPSQMKSPDMQSSFTPSNSSLRTVLQKSINTTPNRVERKVATHLIKRMIRSTSNCAMSSTLSLPTGGQVRNTDRITNWNQIN